MLARLGARLGAGGLGGLAGLLADAAGLEVGLALDVGGALLGGLDDQADLLGGRGGQGAAAEELRFEYAARVRDEIRDLRRELLTAQANEAPA